MHPIAELESDAPKILVGRQAIFDRKLEVYAYELLFRSDQANNLCPNCDGDMATSRTILNAFVEIGLERLTDGKPAFLNLTRAFFTEMPPIPFDPKSVVLEVLEDIPVDERFIDSVRALHGAGYKVALDDFLFEDKWQPLLPYISLIKIEITDETVRDMQRLIEPLQELPVQLLAEKVETREQFRELHALGFDLFQGYFFARPDIIVQKQLKESQLVLTRLLAELNDPDAEVKDIAHLIGRDPALSYKVLRLINSAAIGLRREIESLHQAVVLLGLQRIRAWATLFAMAEAGEQSRELLNLGLLRANLCERLCRLWGKGAPDTAFTVGLLSILDGVLSMPMQQALQELPLPTAVKQAIGERSGDYGEILRTAMDIETGRMTPSDEVERAQLLELFLESSETAFTLLHELE
jgi:EAL and modified HD-GYP domain-containing signal transduction protein